MGLKYRRGSRYFHGGCRTAGLERKVDNDICIDVDDGMGLSDCLKAFGGGIKLVTADSHWGELVRAVLTRSRRQGRGGTFVREGNLGATNYSAGRVLDGSRNAASIYLGVEGSAEQQNDGRHRQ